MATRRNLELASLRSLIAIDAAGSMTAAAKRLHMTQSAISMQIKRMEDALGLRVFERVARGLKPTAAGEQLLQYARQIVSLNDEAWDRLTAADYEGQLVLGAPVDLIDPIVPLAVRAFRREYPRVQVSIRNHNTIDLLALMDQGELDLVLATQTEAGAGGEVLQHRHVSWAGAIDGQAWRQRPLPLAFSRTCIFKSAATTALGRAGIEWIDAIDGGDELAIGAMIAADLAVGAELDLGRHRAQEEIQHNGALPGLPAYAVVLYQRGGADVSLQRALASHIREQVHG